MSRSVHEWGLARGQDSLSLSLFRGLESSNPLLSRSLNFSGCLVFFMSFAKSTKTTSLGFHDRCSGTDCESVFGWWEDCIVYSLFCIFIIIIISIIISISIYFVVLINCLHLNPWVLPFVHFSSLSHWRGRREVSERLPSAELPAAGLNHNSCPGK